MGNKWWNRKAPSRGGNKDWKEAKPPRSPRPRPSEDLIKEYVSVVLKRAGHDDDASLTMLVTGTTTFEDFATKARGKLHIAPETPIHWFVGSRAVAADSHAVMASFPKSDYLELSYM